MKKSVSFLLLALVTVCASPLNSAKAADPAPYAPRVELEDGDTFVFLGDSITHQCLYTQYLETYFYTRYPSKRIRFRNAGVSGDTAGDALLRFDEEVAAFEPGYVSVLIGMNDGGYQAFREDLFSKYEEGMGELFGRLGEISESILMGPSYFDTRSVRVSDRAAHWSSHREQMTDYYPSVLAFFSEWVAEQAQLGGVNFVDMATPMRRVTFEQRRLDPSFTLSKDAVHPEPAGHVLMATAMLADAFLVEPVSTLSLSIRKGGKVEDAGSLGKLENVTFKKGRLRLDFTARGLPWVLPPEADLGFELSEAAERFSGEWFNVSGLKAGIYELRVDLVPMGRFSAAELAMGVDLRAYDQLPQMKQALEVALLNRDRNLQAIKPMRDLWLRRKSKLSPEAAWLAGNGEAADFAERKAAYDAEMEAFRSEIAELEALAFQFEEKIYAANQPQKRRYELTRLKP